MNNKAVLDSSTLLAFINQENGFELVERYLPDAMMSSVNIAEVVAVLALVNIPEDIIISIINDLSIEIIDFDQSQAIQTGFLHKKTKAAGLSLGDRACINLASSGGLAVVTADKIWDTLGLENIIVLIR